MCVGVLEKAKKWDSALCGKCKIKREVSTRVVLTIPGYRIYQHLVGSTGFHSSAEMVQVNFI
jgi:hypothetical protein